VPAIYRLILDLAEYEHSAGEVTGTLADLHRSLFGPHPAVFAHVAEHEGKSAGLPCGSSTTPPGSASTAFTWKTCT
jgi:hypothetical protein